MSANTDTPLRAEGEIFRILADCYHQPDDKLITRISKLTEVAEPFGDIPVGLARKMIEQLEDGTLDALLVDYAKLFVGPFELAAPPFGSVYLEEGHKLMGDSTVDVKQYYRAAGLDMADDFANPPDHIAAELEFLYYLFVREGALREEGSDIADEVDALRKEFLSRHIGIWGVEFADRVRNNAATVFYQALGRLTKVVIDNEMQTVN